MFQQIMYRNGIRLQFLQVFNVCSYLGIISIVWLMLAVENVYTLSLSNSWECVYPPLLILILYHLLIVNSNNDDEVTNDIRVHNNQQFTTSLTSSENNVSTTSPAFSFPELIWSNHLYQQVLFFLIILV